MTFESNCRRIWSSKFFRRLGSLYWQRWPRGPWQARAGEIVFDRFADFEMPERPDAFLSAAVRQWRGTAGWKRRLCYYRIRTVLPS